MNATSPGCADATCCNAVCTTDAFCCEEQWDSACVGEASAVRAYRGGGYNLVAHIQRAARHFGTRRETRWDSLGFRPARSITQDSTPVPSISPGR